MGIFKVIRPTRVRTDSGSRAASCTDRVVRGRRCTCQNRDKLIDANANRRCIGRPSRGDRSPERAAPVTHGRRRHDATGRVTAVQSCCAVGPGGVGSRDRHRIPGPVLAQDPGSGPGSVYGNAVFLLAVAMGNLPDLLG